MTLVYSHMVDLGHSITQDMPVLPGVPHTRLTPGADNGTVQTVEMFVQSGTYLSISVQADEPFATIEYLSPRELVVQAVVLDMRDSAQDRPNYRLSVDDIEAWEQQHGRIPAGCMVLLATGWDMRWNNPSDYLNLDERQFPLVPGFSRQAVDVLLERNVAGLGIDTPDIGVHHDLLVSSDTTKKPDRSLFLLNLTNLEQLPPSGSTLVIGPLKLQHSNASPASVLAFVP